MDKKYQIYERKNPSGNIGYRIHIGEKNIVNLGLNVRH